MKIISGFKLRSFIILSFLSFYAFSIEKSRDKVMVSLIDKQIGGVEKQLFDNSCGIASLSYVLNSYYNKNTSEKNLFFFVGLKPDYSLADFKDISHAFYIESIGLKLTINDLKRIKSPTILRTNSNGGHFIVYTGYKDGWFQIIDPAKGRLNYYTPELEHIFLSNGKAHGLALVFLSKNKNIFLDKKLYKNNTNRLWLGK
ncbi:cysteine peptidase family C39 domain-containing protein [Serratia proteamaculans]|uniref:cysteine peptidase family C39 domain-containing protein n=1 Tax=Serratia proteamaculans TaxID=28151 RepID=UPI00217C7F6A|nr:cysteine peptidase family C39 domain-containing protein [Serratia proteamaculans]CAI1885711.1 NHLM bacteriocin system ABC transporter, peptidase/ATP-binding protein [Serratia proteamaculans]